jgi:phenylalanyl-tRNA synthetase beta chain
MKISYLWLKELTGLDWSAREMADRLTLCGTACEDIESTAKYLNNVIIGQVTDLQAVEGASKIRKATVDTGREKLDIICGAPNVAVGQKVPVALIGARLAGDMEIKKVTIRGVESSGMICSEAELGISADHSGIMVLDPTAPLGKPLAEHLEYDDYIMTFELTPNRGDSMSALGIARDLAALASIKIKRPEIAIRESKEQASQYIRVKIEDPEACPRYAARIVKNVKIGQSPWWVKKKLLTAAIRPINNVVDITNLVMLECGNPLHAFDLELFGSSEVVVRPAHPKEKFVTLDEKEHELSSEVLLITNGKTGVAAAGVMGGLLSGVKESTSTLLLEAAYFNPRVIRKSRRELELVTESSSRFERGADPNGIPYAMNRAAYLFQELCSGEVLTGAVDCYPARIEPRRISLRPERCNAILGSALKPSRMKQILENLEFGVDDGPALAVTAPTFRSDIEKEIDLIEEVGRIEGYDRLPDSIESAGPLFTPIHLDDWFEDELRRVLTAAGFDEIMGHGLADGKQCTAIHPGAPQVRIVNPISDDLSIMRNSLVSTALTVVSHNIAQRNMDLRLFEIGRAYFPPDGDGNWREEDRLSLVVTGNTETTWRDKPRQLDFYDLSGALRNLGQHFHWPGLTFELCAISYLEKAAGFSLTVEGRTVGSIGRVSTDIAKQFDIKQPVWIAEINLAPFIEAGRMAAVYESLPVYPSAPRDIAVVVDATVKVGEIVEVVRQRAGALAEAVEIFDLYAGKQIGEGKKSVGIAITYRSKERSLSSDEVDAVQQDIRSILKRQFNAEIRDK